MSPKKYIDRTFTITVVVVLALAAVLPFIKVPHAYAYGLITSRSIEMNDSNASDTAVTYTVSFIPSTTSETIGGIVVDFCADPIIGDTCTPVPSGLNVSASPTVSGSPTGFSTSTGSWVAGKLGGASPYTTFTFTNTTAQTASATASTPITFSITSMTNPSAVNTTFYARILTYATSGGATGYSSTSVGTPVDAGGIAMSTAAQITITSKVQEQITFCVYTQSNCAGGGTSVLLGDTHDTLSTAGPYVDNTTKYDIGTNAAGGVSIRLKGTTLTSGSNTIAAMGSTAGASSTGNSQFGMCTWEKTGSTLAPVSPYNSANCSNTTESAGTGTPGGLGSPAANFAFNTTNTTSTYGDQIATATAGPTSTGEVAFLGNISSTQTAGIYSTTLTFIATGTY